MSYKIIHEERYKDYRITVEAMFRKDYQEGLGIPKKYDFVVFLIVDALDDRGRSFKKTAIVKPFAGRSMKELLKWQQDSFIESLKENIDKELYEQEMTNGLPDSLDSLIN